MNKAKYDGAAARPEEGHRRQQRRRALRADRQGVRRGRRHRREDRAGEQRSTSSRAPSSTPGSSSARRSPTPGSPTSSAKGANGKQLLDGAQGADRQEHGAADADSAAAPATRPRRAMRLRPAGPGADRASKVAADDRRDDLRRAGGDVDRLDHRAQALLDAGARRRRAAADLRRDRELDVLRLVPPGRRRRQGRLLHPATCARPRCSCSTPSARCWSGSFGALIAWRTAWAR